MSIDATHGIVVNANDEKFVHRNLLDAEGFAGYLRRRPRPYGPLLSAMMNHGDALTIDDSTVAAAQAARLARHLGHQVTLFVNGYNVVRKEPYFFSRLNSALDNASLQTIFFEGRAWNITDRHGKGHFRQAVKRRLSNIRDEAARDEFVTNIGRLLGQEDISVPPYLQVISEDELRVLKALGVDIQNHGWTHARIGSLSSEAHSEDIRLGREWLRDSCDVEAEYYAVPNGDGLPFWDNSPHYRAWFLLDDSRLSGEISPGVFGRKTLTLRD